jgi:hypothetical protein
MIDVIVDEHLLSDLRLLVVLAMALMLLMSFEVVGAWKRRLAFHEGMSRPLPKFSPNQH